MILTKILFQPKVVTDTDEMELAKRLEQLEMANTEVDGDADSSADEDAGTESEKEKADADDKIIEV